MNGSPRNRVRRKVVTITLDPSVLKKVKEHAQQESRSVSNTIEAILAEKFSTTEAARA
jgi:hypothetical protein